ncbi:MAG TPA: hypothetical protein VGP93_00095, partial [Polyangiaceae bacterium]|nr:hypothetical protein [Polyangiaceae bacterium]
MSGGPRPVTLVTLQIALTSAVLVAAARELLSRAPALFLSPLANPRLGLSVALASLGLAAGGSVGFAAGRRAWGAPLSLLSSSLVATLAPVVWCWAFTAQGRLELMAPALTGLSAAVLAAATVATARSLGRESAALGMVPHLLAPFRLGAAALAMALTLGASANLPLGHAGPALGALLALLAVSAAALHQYLFAEKPEAWLGRVAPVAALALSAFALYYAERRLPLGEARRYPGEVL